MKLKTLEQFGQKDPCECGGNCGCGSKPVNEKFNFSKKEVEAAANLIASAISKADKVKANVHDLEYDKGRGAGFEISIDGEKYEGGSYTVKDNGDVVNSAIGNSHPNAVYNTIGNKDIDNIFVNMKKYESVVTESKGYKAGDEVELKTGETVKINQVVKGPRAELNTYRAKVKGKQIDFSLSDINESIDEAKKYKFKELAKAWSHVYGEDMEDEYQGFYQEVTGKYKDKVTKKDIADIWTATYGEDIAADYDGFYNDLKENLEQVAKLEELDNLVEANSDGTISDDEDERRGEALHMAEIEFDEYIKKFKEEAYDIGGTFRGPGIWSDIYKAIEYKLKKAKR